MGKALNRKFSALSLTRAENSKPVEPLLAWAMEVRGAAGEVARLTYTSGALAR